MASINKAEAIAVLRELSQSHMEIASADMVELRKSSNGDQTELKIKCVVSFDCEKSVRKFLEKRNLEMREEKGFIVIY